MNYSPKHRAARASRITRFIGVALAGGATAAVGVATAPTASADVWDRVAACESGGNWSTSTGNGYHGGLQFSQSSWRAAGGTGSAASASKAEQKAAAARLLKMQGPSAWPVCGPKAGLTRSNGASGGGNDSTSSVRRASTSSYSSSTKHTYKSVASNGYRHHGLTIGQVKELQDKVGASVDGVVGPETVRKTESYLGLEHSGRSHFSGSELRKVNRLV